MLALVIMALTAVGGSGAGMAGVNLQYASCPPAGKTTYLGGSRRWPALRAMGRCCWAAGCSSVWPPH